MELVESEDELKNELKKDEVKDFGGESKNIEEQNNGVIESNRVVAFILINTEHDKTRLVSKKISRIKEVSEVYEIYGQYDIIVKIETMSINSLKDILYNKIRLMDGVLKTETLLTM